jgi:large subunit ribosomal protein L21
MSDVAVVARGRQHEIPRGPMYAVIETGGKQYRVEVGTELEVELLDVEPGKTITLERVLLVADGAESSIGRPLVAGAEVSAEVVRQSRGEKLISFKYRPKARSRVKKGHRQELTVLRINDITLDGKSAAKAAKKAQDEAKTERMRLEDAAAAQAAKDAELAARLAVGAEAATTPPTARGKPARSTKTASVKAEAPKAAAKAKGATAKAEAPAGAPKRSRAKAATNDDAGPARPAAAKSAAAKSTAAKPAAAKPETPKRSRATKKDE